MRNDYLPDDQGIKFELPQFPEGFDLELLYKAIGEAFDNSIMPPITWCLRRERKRPYFHVVCEFDIGYFAVGQLQVATMNDWFKEQNKKLFPLSHP